MRQRIIYNKNILQKTMNPRILVVAKSATTLSRFEQSSLQSAFNLKDFLEETGEYDDVSIFQLSPTAGAEHEWVKLAELEC